METTTIRISRRARDEARALAAATGRPLSQTVEAAIEGEGRRMFWRRFRAATARVRADPEIAAAEVAETEALEGTLLDGLEDEDVPR